MKVLEELSLLSFGESRFRPNLHRTAITLKRIVPTATERYRKIEKSAPLRGTVWNCDCDCDREHRVADDEGLEAIMA
jgi:hypothetical protein